MKSVKKNRTVIFIVYVISSFLLIIASYSKSGHYQLSRFVKPEICSGCHEGIYNQWRYSMHSLALVDPVYKKVASYFLKGLTVKDEILEAESCPKCHTPIGYMTGLPVKTSEEKQKLPDIAVKGIQCDFCHSATGAERNYNNSIAVEPGFGEDNPGTKRGPFKDSDSEYHDSAYSKFHTESKICGTCHNVRHVVYGTKLESTYDEWLKGPYNSDDPKKRITCQGCHMYQRLGYPATGSTERPKNPGSASDFSKKREHIFTHYFVGGNGFVPSLFNDKIRLKMAEERLKNAAELSIDASGIKDYKLVINIKNSGAGHYLPTGLTNVRQMWLEISITDHKRRVVYRSGRTDKNGYITEGTIIYNTVFGDGKGKPVVNISKAREILSDKRIPPMKTVSETIKLPSGRYRYINVNIKLLYRSVPQRSLDSLMGRGKVKFPVITMEELNKKVIWN